MDRVLTHASCRVWAISSLSKVKRMSTLVDSIATTTSTASTLTYGPMRFARLSTTPPPSWTTKRDPIRRSKKALIGNDFVHIVFNESGKDYRFGTIAVNSTMSTYASLSDSGAASTLDRLPRKTRCSIKSPCSVVRVCQSSPPSAMASYSAPKLYQLCAHLGTAQQRGESNLLGYGRSMQPYSSNWVSRLGHIRRARQQYAAKQRAKAEAEGQVVQEGSGARGCRNVGQLAYGGSV